MQNFQSNTKFLTVTHPNAKLFSYNNLVFQSNAVFQKKHSFQSNAVFKVKSFQK